MRLKRLPKSPAPKADNLRVAINGYGRIGRSVLRALYESAIRSNLEIVAINELADSETIVHLTKYDSVHGRFRGEVSLEGDCLIANNDRIRLFHCEDPADLPWGKGGVDLVLDCSGQFCKREDLQKHIDAGAKAVLLSQPGEPSVDATVVYGVNHQDLQGDEQIFSASSCTSNCVVPILKVLNDAYGVESGALTTIHSAMNDQPLTDAFHHTNLRKTRSAMNAIIPIDTGLARGIDRVLPELAGRFEAQALRVPTQNVSLMDITVLLKTDVTVEEVNALLREASKKTFVRLLGYTEEPLASCDFNHDKHSGTVDASQTRVSQKRLVKLLAWFDNEWAYANRMLDVAKYWAEKRQVLLKMQQEAVG